MKVAFARGIAALGLFFLASTSGFAQSLATSPTTRILAIGTINPGVDPAQVRAILPTEVRKTVDLYLEGKIDQWYALQGRMGVVFILNVTDEAAARDMLERLPLGQAHLMSFTLSPLAPLTPLRALPGMAESPSQ
ncbi:muconolactone Delta-isomerase family protein [Paraburkholderia sp. ZP32-5]|uniref:muconolactone Delta-isomerase family protein n=1 Tax=Paraburkholderia sp. ZP32-5 TaxID=2883245 RepID=UPI001F45AD47|nr:muconolactone Delta-isomerase family protein [Paraburkholderia sp. ZP32-5]